MSRLPFQKPLVKLCKVCAAFAAVETDFAQDLGIVQLLAEGSVLVLNETGGQHRVVGHFKKF